MFRYKIKHEQVNVRIARVSGYQSPRTGTQGPPDILMPLSLFFALYTTSHLHSHAMQTPPSERDCPAVADGTAGLACAFAPLSIDVDCSRSHFLLKRSQAFLSVLL